MFLHRQRSSRLLRARSVLCLVWALGCGPPSGESQAELRAPVTTISTQAKPTTQVSPPAWPPLQFGPYSSEPGGHGLPFGFQVHELILDMDPLDWQRMRELADKTQWFPATLTHQGRSFSTGVRVKGHKTLVECLHEGVMACPKFSIKFNFHKFVGPGEVEVDFHGLKRLNLHASTVDHSFTRELLGYELNRRMGLPVPRVGFVWLMLGNQPQGLFISVEELDRHFMKRWLGETGDLVKEAWSHNAALRHAQAKGSPKPRRQRSYEALSELEHLLGNPAELNRAVDTQNFARSLAAEFASGHADGATRFYCPKRFKPGRPEPRFVDCHNHNFSWYRSSQEQLSLVAWDRNQSFWTHLPNLGIRLFMPFEEVCKVEWWNEHARYDAHCDPLSRALVAAAPEGTYGSALMEIHEQHYPALVDLAERTRTLVRPWLERDPNVPSLAEFNAAHGKLKRLMQQQRRELRHVVRALRKRAPL